MGLFESFIDPGLTYIKKHCAQAIDQVTVHCACLLSTVLYNYMYVCKLLHVHVCRCVNGRQCVHVLYQLASMPESL